GKVDLRALEMWPLTAPREAPAAWTGAAAVLASIWCEVLGLDAVEAGDDFGALGGDSVALVEVLARAEAAGLALSAERALSRPIFGDLCADLDGAAAPRRAEDVTTLLAELPART